MTLTPGQWFALGVGLYAGLGIPATLGWWYWRRYRRRQTPAGEDELDAAELLDQTDANALHTASTPFSSPYDSGSSRGQSLGRPSHSRTLSESPSEPSTASFTPPSATTRESVNTIPPDYPSAIREGRTISGRPPDSDGRTYSDSRATGYTHASRDSRSTSYTHATTETFSTTNRLITDTGRTAQYSRAVGDRRTSFDHGAAGSSHPASDRFSTDTARTAHSARSGCVETDPRTSIEYRPARDSRSTVDSRLGLLDGGRAARHSVAADACDRRARDSYGSSCTGRYSQTRRPSSGLDSTPPGRSSRASTPLAMPVPQRAARPAPFDPPVPFAPLAPPADPRPPRSPGAVTILKDVLFAGPDAGPGTGPSRGRMRERERVVVQNEEDAEAVPVRYEMLPPRYRPEWGEAHAAGVGAGAGGGAAGGGTSAEGTRTGLAGDQLPGDVKSAYVAGVADWDGP